MNKMESPRAAWHGGASQGRVRDHGVLGEMVGDQSRCSLGEGGLGRGSQSLWTAWLSWAVGTLDAHSFLETSCLCPVNRCAHLCPLGTEPCPMSLHVSPSWTLEPGLEATFCNQLGLCTEKGPSHHRPRQGALRGLAEPSRWCALTSHTGEASPSPPGSSFCSSSF